MCYTNNIDQGSAGHKKPRFKAAVRQYFQGIGKMNTPKDNELMDMETEVFLKYKCVVRHKQK